MKKTSIVLASLIAVAANFLISCSSPATPEVNPSTLESSSSAREAASSTPKASIGNGEKIYTQYCLPCHQADGSGVSQLNPPLKNTEYVLGDESRLIGIVMNGFSEGVEINGDAYTNPMPPFGTSVMSHLI